MGTWTKNNLEGAHFTYSKYFLSSISHFNSLQTRNLDLSCKVISNSSHSLSSRAFLFSLVSKTWCWSSNSFFNVVAFHHSYTRTYNTTLVYENLSNFPKFSNLNQQAQAHHKLVQNISKYTCMHIICFGLTFISITHLTAIFQPRLQHSLGNVPMVP